MPMEGSENWDIAGTIIDDEYDIPGICIISLPIIADGLPALETECDPVKEGDRE